MTEELKSYLRDLDYAFDTAIENVDAKYRKLQRKQDKIDELMRMRFIKKIPSLYVYELQIYSHELIQKVYGKRKTVLAE